MTEGPDGWRWALPMQLPLPPDRLRARVDIFQETILLHLLDGHGVTTKPVSALDIAQAFARELSLSSGLLPEGALWWSLGPEGAEVALWREPQVWKVALQLEAFQPPRRFRLPMPGLVFVCSSGRQPRVYAAKRRPMGLDGAVYEAPLFNVMDSGMSCAGTHRYSNCLSQIPEEFMTSFFTPAGDHRGRSHKHPDNLLALWEALDGKRRFPLKDLVPLGKVEQVMGMK